MQEEIWQPIDGTQEIYWVSTKGRVKRRATTKTLKNGRVRAYPEKIMKPTTAKTGIVVSVKGKPQAVAKLVAMTFVPNPRGLKQLYHKDGNIFNNDASNLAWGLPSVKLYEGNDLSEIEWLMLNYDVTRDGHIIRKSDGKELTPSPDRKGYLRIRLKNPAFAVNKDDRKAYKVHRLVAMYYLEDYSDELQVNHINGNKQDNRVENIEMVTNAQNAWHAWNVLDSSKRREAMRKYRDKRTGRLLKQTV